MHFLSKNLIFDIPTILGNLYLAPLHTICDFKHTQKIL